MRPSFWTRLWGDERGLIGTAAAIGIGLASAGASAASNIYGSKRAGSYNEKALRAQERADQDAMRFEREQAERNEVARRENLAADQKRWDDYLNAHKDRWAMGGRVLGDLYDMAGRGRGAAPSMNIPSAGSAPPPAASGIVPTGVPGRPTLENLAQGSGRRIRPRLSRAPAVQMPTGGGGGMSLQDLMQLAAMSRGGGQGAKGPIAANRVSNIGVLAPNAVPRYR